MHFVYNKSAVEQVELELTMLGLAAAFVRLKVHSHRMPSVFCHVAVPQGSTWHCTTPSVNESL